MNRREFNKNSILMTMGIFAYGALSNSWVKSSNKRSVYKVIDSTSGGMGHLNLKNIIQGDYQNYVSPFFLVDEFGPMNLSKNTPFRVDAHPHAGIIPTTYLLHGNAHHRDSMGNDFEYKEGDFIHFTSGRGALHMEETGNELYNHGGVFHGMQAWLNIPSKLKKTEPLAALIKNENSKVVLHENASIKVILGEVFGVRSNTELIMPVIYWHVQLNENSELELPVESLQNAFVYVLKGEVETQGNHFAKAGQTILYERDGDSIYLKTLKASEFLVLGGQVNNESYVAYGPFVLNSEEEIRQAYSDFQAGKFGDVDATNGVKR